MHFPEVFLHFRSCGFGILPRRLLGQPFGVRLRPILGILLRAGSPTFLVRVTGNGEGAIYRIEGQVFHTCD